MLDFNSLGTADINKILLLLWAQRTEEEQLTGTIEKGTNCSHNKHVRLHLDQFYQVFEKAKQS